MTGKLPTRLVVTMLCFLFWGVGVAQSAVTLIASVSPNRALVGDTISYTVTVSGELSEVTHPLVSFPDSFRQLQKDPQISQRVSIVNGKYSRNVDFVYQLSCLKSGKFTFPPASLRADNAKYDSNAAPVVILSGGNSSGKNGTNVESGMPRLLAEVLPEEAYVGQAISIVISMYVPRAQIFNGQWGWMEKPSGVGFLPEPVKGPAAEWKLTTVSGVPTMVCVLGRYVVTPTQPGQYNFKPGIAMVLLKDNSKRKRRRSLMDSFFDDDFFGRSRNKKVNVAGLPVSFTVKPLPAGMGADKGLLCVSDLVATARVSRTRLNENEPVTYTLSFKGNGDLRSLSAPALSIADNFRVFESKSDSSIVFDARGIRSSKIFEYLIVPTRSGNLKLPEVAVECFDPHKSQIVRAVAPAVDLQAIPGEKEENIQMVLSHPSKQAVKIMGRDIHYIAESRKDSLSLRETRVHSKKVFWILLLLPLLMAVFDHFYSNRRALSVDEKQAMRASSALKTARLSLSTLKGDKDDSKKYYSGLRALMIKYVADKLGLSPSGTIFSEVRELILAKSVSEEELKQFEEYLELFSSAAFSPVKPTKDAMVKEANELSSLLSDIDRRWS